MGVVFVNLNLYAQDTIPVTTDTVVVSRLVCSINPQYAFVNDSLEKSVIDTIVSVQFLFKIKNAQNVQFLYVNVGTFRDSSDCINASYSCENNGGILNFYRDSIVVATISNGMVSFNEPFPLKEINRINWISVYSKDIFGHYSNRAYYQFLKEE
jgi:hypothetical protein